MHLEPAAVRPLHGRGVRREFHQPANGVASAVQRPGFDRFGNGEEDHHHGRFGPVADQDRAGHRYRHQRIDVQVAIAEGDQSLPVCRQAAEDDRDERERDDGPVIAAIDPVHGLCERCSDTGGRHSPPARDRRLRMSHACPRDGCTGRIPGRVEAPGPHSNRRERIFDLLNRVWPVTDCKSLLDQVEIESLDAGQCGQFAAYQALLGRAIHVFDEIGCLAARRCGPVSVRFGAVHGVKEVRAFESCNWTSCSGFRVKR